MPRRDDFRATPFTTYFSAIGQHDWGRQLVAAIAPAMLMYLFGLLTPTYCVGMRATFITYAISGDSLRRHDIPSRRPFTGHRQSLQAACLREAAIQVPARRLCSLFREELRLFSRHSFSRRAYCSRRRDGRRHFSADARQILLHECSSLPPRQATSLFHYTNYYREKPGRTFRARSGCRHAREDACRRRASQSPTAQHASTFVAGISAAHYCCRYAHATLSMLYSR